MPAANLYPPRPLAQHQLPPARCEMLRAKVRLHVPAAMSRPPAQHDASQKPSTHDLAPRGVAARRRQAVSQPPLTTLLKSKLGATHPHVKCYAELDAPAAGRSWRLWAFGFVPKREKPRSVEPWRRLPRPWLRWSGDAREDGPRCMRATQRPTCVFPFLPFRCIAPRCLRRLPLQGDCDCELLRQARPLKLPRESCRRRRTGTCVAPSVGDKVVIISVLSCMEAASAALSCLPIVRWLDKYDSESMCNHMPRRGRAWACCSHLETSLFATLPIYLKPHHGYSRAARRHRSTEGPSRNSPQLIAHRPIDRTLTHPSAPVRCVSPGWVR